MSKFSERIKELRMEKELSQNRFAPLVGYTQQTVSDWEKGTMEPNANAIIACAVYFGVTADYLLGLENEDGSKVKTVLNLNNRNI